MHKRSPVIRHSISGIMMAKMTLLAKRLCFPAGQMLRLLVALNAHAIQLN